MCRRYAAASRTTPRGEGAAQFLTIYVILSDLSSEGAAAHGFPAQQSEKVAERSRPIKSSYPAAIKTFHVEGRQGGSPPLPLWADFPKLHLTHLACGCPLPAIPPAAPIGVPAMVAC
eukprot:2276211-Amphidinium_carterae.1